MNDFSGLDDEELLAVRAAVAKEASRRGLLVSIGDIGEKLVLALFKSRPDLPVLAAAPRGTKNIDAISRDGERYSIKTLLRAKKTGTVYPDADDPERQLFEHMVIAVLTEDAQLEKALLLSWKQFCRVRSWDIRMNAWYVAKSKRVFNDARQIFPHELSRTV